MFTIFDNRCLGRCFGNVVTIRPGAAINPAVRPADGDAVITWSGIDVVVTVGRDPIGHVAPGDPV
ncbi:hypothetical protein D3C85_1304150 [compost metagenome]